MVTVFSGEAVRKFSETRQDSQEQAEGAVIVLNDFACFLNVLPAGMGVAKIAPQGFIFKENLIDPGCHVC